MGLGSLFSKGGSSTASTTANTTNNDSRQQNRVNTSGADSLILGDGNTGSIHIERLDAATTEAAITGMANTAGAGFAANKDTVVAALNAAENLGKYSTDAAVNLGAAALAAASGTQRDSLALADKSVAAAASAFQAASSGDTAQLQTTIEKILMAAIFGGVVLGAAYLLKSSK